MTIFEGNYSPKDLRIGIVVARFNEFINQKLLQGALDNLKRHGVKEEQIDIYWVPGAFEIPFITKKLSKKDSYDGLITLGTVIRGATTLEYAFAVHQFIIVIIQLKTNVLDKFIPYIHNSYIGFCVRYLDQVRFDFTNKLLNRNVVFSGTISKPSKMPDVITDCIINLHDWIIYLGVNVTSIIIIAEKACEEVKISIIPIPIYFTDVGIVQKEIDLFF